LTGAVADEFSAFPKAAKKITGQLDVVLAFYDLPAEHLDPPADHQSHRVDLLDRAAPHQGHPLSGVA